MEQMGSTSTLFAIFLGKSTTETAWPNLPDNKTTNRELAEGDGTPDPTRENLDAG
jgi:hypothetical protein